MGNYISHANTACTSFADDNLPLRRYDGVAVQNLLNCLQGTYFSVSLCPRKSFHVKVSVKKKKGTKKVLS